MKINVKILLLTLAMAILVSASSIRAATMSSSATAPAVDGEDIASYGTPTGQDKWWPGDADAFGNPGKTVGQTFTTGGNEVLLSAFTFQIRDATEPTKEYTIRVGTISGTTFTEIASETATQGFSTATDNYWTWTLDTPLLLSPNTVYGVDVGLNSSTSGWTTGIPYVYYTGDVYADGTRFRSGTAGYGIGDATMTQVSGERVFHIDLEHPMSPSPLSGATVPAGDVDLSWTNLPPNVGNDVWVDVWFGTDPVTDFVKVVDAGLNTTSVTVNAPVGDTYYWRVDSYLEGAPTGDPVESSVFIFYVDDTDGDGLPDDYELLYTDPPSTTALNPGDDLEPDGLTNMEEYNLGTVPNNPDTDGDTLQDGPELSGVGLRPPTDPLDPDTDNDSFDDGVETNTGTWVSPSDTGTDPTNPDSDGDGLTDQVETNTGTFVDENDTGTHPLLLNSDSDNADDWYEVAASYTDPTDAGDSPIIPYPLPDPDGSTGNSNPVKVYIMSGQSNMVGFGRTSGIGPGYLDYMCNTENKFPNLVDGAGAWLPRNDVMYRGVISAIGDDYLRPGFGAGGSEIGPELGFGQVMGYYHDEPVLLIKSSIGNRSISWDYAPPSTVPFVYNGTTYAGYGDYGNWPEGGDPPTTGGWYCGKQYDDCFLRESDMGPRDWINTNLYTSGCQVRSAGIVYNCSTEHTSDTTTEPGVGANWAPYWNIHSIFNVVDILDNFATEYPQYATQGFEIAGFAWWQGHKDQSDPHSSRYEQNMVRFINDIRAYYESRYPANTVPDAPFVLATVAFDGGWDNTSTHFLNIANGQLAVSGETGNYPEFEGNVKTMEARGYWRDGSVSPTTTGYHYNHNSETYMLVGDALGRAMVELINGDPVPDTDPPTPDPAAFTSAPAAVSDTEITMTATTGSDATGPVEYYFDEISGNPGGTDSGWTTDPVYNDTGLDPSTQYTYTVQMRDSVTPTPNVGTVSSPASATTDPAPAIPAAPSNLSATAISKTRIDLDWTDNSDNETGFKIERSKRVNTNFTQIDTVGPDVTSYSDTTAKKNTLYYYRVRATNAYGDSAYSNEASARTPK
ncbi:MAG: fibronectin type III domain-containing protein [Planctomycetota bacterium]|jgi:hypothetical protein